MAQFQDWTFARIVHIVAWDPGCRLGTGLKPEWCCQRVELCSKAWQEKPWSRGYISPFFYLYVSTVCVCDNVVCLIGWMFDKIYRGGGLRMTVCEMPDNVKRMNVTVIQIEITCDLPWVKVFPCTTSRKQGRKASYLTFKCENSATHKQKWHSYHIKLRV